MSRAEEKQAGGERETLRISARRVAGAGEAQHCYPSILSAVASNSR
jgi:hypothetical protein